MKIKRIEYRNFRNFKGEGGFNCSTDGKLTIIYGKNGDGKTTLHQLFQWILYDQLNFNKTTTDRIYNLSYESELPYNSVFEVMGRLDFEDSGRDYSVTRTRKYKKGSDGSAVISQDFQVNYRNDDDSWLRVDDPQQLIEKMLPSGLKDYFFFDGEGMISDLRYKGKDSAGNLKKALYSIFDLDVINEAISHIGNTDLRTTVLGKLFLEKGKIASGTEIDVAKTRFENAQKEIERIEDDDWKARTKKAELQEYCNEISEKIGSSESRTVYEQFRVEALKNRDIFLNNMYENAKDFGNEVVRVYPRLLMSKAVENAKHKIELNLQDAKCPPGLEKTLVKYLQKNTTKFCICGKPIDDHSRECFEELAKMFQPYSNDAAYSDFIRQTEIIGKDYNREILEDKIARAVRNQSQAFDCEQKATDYEKMIKNVSDESERLIEERQKALSDISSLDEMINTLGTQLTKYKALLRKSKKEYNELTEATEAGRIADNKIKIMEEVLSILVDRLDNQSQSYSKCLQDNIDGLLAEMLTSKRSVSVSKDFTVRITDSFNDESKSEGQFAVVSFAYIGGILKMLKEEVGLQTKEYPLVLDGPFSKLDEDQKQNVIDCLPKFAPQLILFSKDPLQDYIPEDEIGYVYTISSNDEKNVAEVKEGFLWN